MKKFKTAIAIMLAMTTLFSLTACTATKKDDSAPPAGNDQNDQENESTDVYIIATDTTFAPFEFQDKDGNFVGIDMEILEAVAADQGFTYELQILGFNAAVQALEANQVDGVIAGMSITEERQLMFDFSAPYFDSGVVMGIAVDNDTIESYEDLSGQKVAIKTGTEGAAFAESIKDTYGFETVVFDDSAYMYEDVKIGNTVACFEDYPVLGYAISQEVGLKIVTEKEQGSSYGFAVGKGLNQELLEMFNSGFDNIVASGKYQEILDKYIQE